MIKQIFHAHCPDSTKQLRYRHWIGYARNSGDARRKANSFLGSDPKHYTVEPLTMPGDRAHISVDVGE